MNLPAQPTEAGIDDHIRSVVGLSDQLLGQRRRSLQRIDEINRTTHVISMNARIESARIGQAGRGFSVIAQEMEVLSRRVADATQDLDKGAASTSADMRHTLQRLEDDVRRTRLSELALSNIDLIDRNLYERSCDVRWWATEAAIMPPRALASAGSDVSAQAWFEDATRTRSGEEFGFQDVHASTLADGERVLGVLGIPFRWDALAQTVVQRTPLSEQEWGAAGSASSTSAARSWPIRPGACCRSGSNSRAATRCSSNRAARC